MVPLDGKQCDIVVVIIQCDRASMFTVCHPNLVALIELLYRLVDRRQSATIDDDWRLSECTRAEEVQKKCTSRLP